jgi:hypothetical protein
LGTASLWIELVLVGDAVLCSNISTPADRSSLRDAYSYSAESNKSTKCGGETGNTVELSSHSLETGRVEGANGA